MKQLLSHKDILRLLKAEKAFLRNEFGVITIGLFGSYAKGNQQVDSDIDLLVELKEPRFEWIAGLQIYLEKRFDKKIELVRKSDNVNRRFTQRIENEMLYA
ncbi:MAG: nucleotidyltransferase domain-containing protein [Gammaproteobacteria bacterium]|nr:nucleotidyltransferase domain-containing protein [Gammaproteobacteria bacterium]